MNIIKEADFRKEIKSNPQKCYLFFGEEEYMKGYALKMASEALSPDPTLAFFNEIKLDSLSYSSSALLDAIMAMPMMADSKLIILQNLDFKSMRPTEIDDFCAALDTLDEYDYNTVIISTTPDRFDAGRAPKNPSSLMSRIGERATCVHFEKNTPARLAAWLSKHFEHNGVKASSDVCMALIDRSGRDMFTLASETDKLSFYALSQGRDTVTLDDVANVSVAVMEHDTYAFVNAIASRRRDKALEVLFDMKSRRLEPVIIMGMVTDTACELLAVRTLADEGLTSGEIAKILKYNEYRVAKLLGNTVSTEACRRMVEACRATDLEIKRSFTSGYEPLERLICTI